MTIGELNRRIEILEYVKERDSYGGIDREWQVLTKVWAKIVPVSGTEYFRSQQVNAETTTRVTVRFNAVINVTHRIRYDGKLFEVIGVTDDETSHRWTVINCKELVNEKLQRTATEGQGQD